MDQLIEGLTRGDAYPHEAEPVGLTQTHISAVFLAGPFAYKVKKPVRFAFLDFSTLERRRRFCHEEVRLNRRLAPDIYHGVVPIIGEPDGPRVLDVLLEDPADSARLESGHEVVEWAVRMTRLPEERTLKSLLRGDELDHGRATAFVHRLARLLAEFHATADRGRETARIGDFPSIAANARENFEELADAVGHTISEQVLGRLRDASESTLARFRPLMERRARENVSCDGHGDLRLGHIYHLPDGSEEGRIAILDCIEFNERFRYSDPVADIAFLVMELEFESHPELASTFAQRYLEAAGDPDGAELIPYYVAYRDIVRGKVHTLTSRDSEIPRPQQAKAAARATRHFLRAVSRLAPPEQRPALLIVAGLPGVGKSVLARALEERAGFVWIDTDQVRKQIAALDARSAGPAAFEAGIYDPEMTERTYEECLRRTGSLLFDGARVVVEGSFRAERHRKAFLDAGRALGVPALLVVCQAERDVVRRRLVARSGRPPELDGSDADWGVYQEMAGRWEEPTPDTAAAARRVRSDRPVEEVLRQATDILSREGLTPAPDTPAGRSRAS